MNSLQNFNALYIRRFGNPSTELTGHLENFQAQNKWKAVSMKYEA